MKQYIKTGEGFADTRIHGTTKRQVAAMFAEEQPQLQPLPIEPFRYYQYGTRTVHLDGCVEIAGAYYAPPPGWLGRVVAVQWDDHHARLLDPATPLACWTEFWRRTGRSVSTNSQSVHGPVIFGLGLGAVALGVIAYNLGNFLRRLVLPLAIQSWSLTSLQQRLFKTGGRLIRHARYFILQLDESPLTQRLFAQIIRRIERLAWHPT